MKFTVFKGKSTKKENDKLKQQEPLLERQLKSDGLFKKAKSNGHS